MKDLDETSVMAHYESPYHRGRIGEPTYSQAGKRGRRELFLCLCDVLVKINSLRPLFPFQFYPPGNSIASQDITIGLIILAAVARDCYQGTGKGDGVNCFFDFVGWPAPRNLVQS